MTSPGVATEEDQMYDTTFAKANHDYRRQVLSRSWTHHRNPFRVLFGK